MGQGTISPNTAISSETAIAVFGNWTRLNVKSLSYSLLGLPTYLPGSTWLLSLLVNPIKLDVFRCVGLPCYIHPQVPQNLLIVTCFWKNMLQYL